MRSTPFAILTLLAALTCACSRTGNPGFNQAKTLRSGARSVNQQEFKEKAMKNWKNLCKMVALFALAAMLNLAYVERARAFTQVESQFIPAVQLTASQTAQVSVCNFSAASVSLTINIFDSNGNISVTKTVTLSSKRTTALRFTNGKTTATYSATLSVSAANSVASDFQVLASNGQVLAINPAFLELSADQSTGPARLVPGQSGAATITNISTVPAAFTLQVFDDLGTLVVTQTGTINIDQTLTFSFSNTGKANHAYFAVASTSAANTLASNLISFNPANGQMIVAYPPGHCRTGSN
jgi:hypothetical protein